MVDVKVLVIEDDDGIARPLIEGLQREGHDVTRVATVADALAAAPSELVLLDLRLPDGDGLDVCRQLRARSAVPIIIVSARGEEIDRVVGLEMGADDYLVKPFGMRELLARIKAVTRRTAQTGSPGDTASPAAVSEFAGLRVDTARRIAWVSDAEVDLTHTEFDVLAYLVAAEGAVVSRRDLMRDVWGSAWYGPSKTIDMHMANLRRKLSSPGAIETVRGVGYRLRKQAG